MIIYNLRYKDGRNKNNLQKKKTKTKQKTKNKTWSKRWKTRVNCHLDLLVSTPRSWVGWWQNWQGQRRILESPKVSYSCPFVLAYRIGENSLLIYIFANFHFGLKINFVTNFIPIKKIIFKMVFAVNPLTEISYVANRMPFLLTWRWHNH